VGYSAGINLYAYCGNNPVNYTDPMGLCPEDAETASPAEEEMALLQDFMSRWPDYLTNIGILKGKLNEYGDFLSRNRLTDEQSTQLAMNVVVGFCGGDESKGIIRRRGSNSIGTLWETLGEP